MCLYFLASKRILFRKIQIYESSIGLWREHFVCGYTLLYEYVTALGARHLKQGRMNERIYVTKVYAVSGM
jgi:hypothetical protein